MTFIPRRRETGKFVDDVGRVEGDLTVDPSFDGKTVTVPRGVIYVVTGGGGASLHDTDRVEREENANDFTVAFVADRHSLTLIDLTAEEAAVRQVSEFGETLDEFRVRRAEAPTDSRPGGPLDIHPPARQAGVE